MARVVVVGHGAAGLTAALAAAETARAAGVAARITVVERAAEGEHGGNTRFTPCYMRLEAPDRVSPGFLDEMLAISGGRNDRSYFERLAADAPATMAWLQSHGIPFHTPVYYLSVGPARIQPIGGGETIVAKLTLAARAAGIAFRYSCRAMSLTQTATSAISGLIVDTGIGKETIPADAVVLACGGFQGDARMLREHLGPGGETLAMISPGTRNNAGHGIAMALAAGAAPSGDWRGMHAEPIDPRARTPAAVMLLYPYGILVDSSGRRFVDEGAGLVHETWEDLARAIHFEQPGRIVHAVLDSRVLRIPHWQRAVRSEAPPLEAPTLAGLAQLIGVPPATLEATVAAYNAACTGDPARFDATVKDGLAAAAGLTPPKSNWARAILQPPYLAWPLIGAIAYTFGGLATDTGARVLSRSGTPIPGLYAAGEITGHFHGTAPNAVAVLRAAVFGRIAGRAAVAALT